MILCPALFVFFFFFFFLIITSKGQRNPRYVFNHHPSREASSVSRLEPPSSLAALRRHWDQTKRKENRWHSPLKRQAPFSRFDLSIQVRLFVSTKKKNINLCDFQPCVGVSFLEQKKKKLKMHSINTQIFFFYLKIKKNSVT